MNIAVKLPQVVLGLAFLGAGGSKLAGADQMVDDFERFRYPQWFRVATGAVEMGGAAGMLAGLSRPVLAPVAGLLLSATMAGALATHLRMQDPPRKMAPPAALLTLAAFVSLKSVVGLKGGGGRGRAPQEGRG